MHFKLLKGTGRHVEDAADGELRPVYGREQRTPAALAARRLAIVVAMLWLRIRRPAILGSAGPCGRIRR